MIVLNIKIKKHPKIPPSPITNIKCLFDDVVVIVF